MKKRIISVITDYAYQVQNILAKGQCNGDIISTIDPAATALLFIGMMQPLIILSQSEDSSVDILKKEMWAVYVRGIRN